MRGIIGGFWVWILAASLLCGCAGKVFERHDTALELVVRATAGRVLTDHPQWVDASYKITADAIRAIQTDEVTSLDLLEQFIVSRIAWDKMSYEEKDLLMFMIGQVRLDVTDYLKQSGEKDPQAALVRVAKVLQWINQTAEIRRSR